MHYNAGLTNQDIIVYASETRNDGDWKREKNPNNTKIVKKGMQLSNPDNGAAKIRCNPSKSHKGRDRQSPTNACKGGKLLKQRKEKAITFAKGAGIHGAEFNESFGRPPLNIRYQPIE
ncbi:hypothetical protein TNCT_691871 [Trichonephila clavata]|uniref:Uncharacterized protein n=1 Tax=Trichonephila clavata TaxID=2740835 RepID=A0A8X6LND7_TRICU|nr:hypothetical protein TNCT_691871 [Trichonephila clavata]